jgi:hypothetical protein
LTDERRTYRFGPVERHGFLGTIRGGQATVVVAGALAGLLLLGSSPSPSHAVGSIAVFAVSVAAATAPVGGRTLEQWLPVVFSWLLRRITLRDRFHSRTPVAGITITDRRFTLVRDQDLALPHTLRGVRVIGLPYRGREIGAMSERGGRWLTVLLACRAVSFALLDQDSQERSLHHWGTTLAACAGTAVRRVQWLERTAPAEPDELARWLEAERDPGLAVRGEPIMDSYLELIDRTVEISQDHEILIAIQADTGRIRARERSAITAAVVEDAERVADGLRRAGAQVHGALTPGHVAALLRTSFDPYVRAELPSMNGKPHAEEHSAWPVAASEAWDHYRTDGAVHATYWIAGWPRIDVGPLFLDPLLSHSSAVRTVAVTFEALPQDRSIREVEAQVTRDQADRALRARFGQAQTARQEQTYGATRRREAELAAGYGEVRFAGFITVSAPDLEQLRGDCAQVRRDAARARLELHGMYGQEADALALTLPLCRGLR